MRNDSPSAAERPSSTPRWGFTRREQAPLAVLFGLAGLALLTRIGCLAWSGGGIARYEDLPRRSATLQIGLNTAGWAELATLPGIGEGLAREIVAYRQSHGPFRTLEELGEVRGIGPRRWHDLRPFLSLD